MQYSEQITRLLPDLEYPIISYGLPFPQACAKHVETTLSCSNVYVIISGSLSRNTDALERLESALGKENIRVGGVRKGMKPHSLYSEILDTAAEVERSGADCIITVGGGSLIDAAKIIPFAIANKADTFEKFDFIMKESLKYAVLGQPVDDGWKGTFKPSSISIVCVPTTLSAGEYNPIAGGTNDNTMHKQLGRDPSYPGPKIIIWDAELAMTTPVRVWLSTGMRAVDHCVESYCALSAHPTASEASKRGIKLLTSGLIRTKRSLNDPEARLDSLKGAMESMVFLRFGILPGGSHGIGHQIGPYGVPHGETTCVMLPAVLKYNSVVNLKQQTELFGVLWEDETTAELLRKWGAADLGGAIDTIVRELDLPRSLEEVGVGRDKFEAIAESSIHDRLCANNPIPLTKKEQVLEILEMAA